MLTTLTNLRALVTANVSAGKVAKFSTSTRLSIREVILVDTINYAYFSECTIILLTHWSPLVIVSMSLLAGDQCYSHCDHPKTILTMNLNHNSVSWSLLYTTMLNNIFTLNIYAFYLPDASLAAVVAKWKCLVTLHLLSTSSLDTHRLLCNNGAHLLERNNSTNPMYDGVGKYK